MEFSGRLFLAAIEEDNAQRALFRVRPLLSNEGEIPQEEIETLSDEGFLRVVPDRGEQHTFKERMRGLGQLCLIDLRSVSAETNKVRNNKNYAPNYGERNRYVIYSDAIRELSEVEVYEVVAEGRAAQPDTLSYYLRKGGHIQGPFIASSTEPASPLSCIAPDNSRLFSVTMPDGREKLYYWPEQPESNQSVAPQPREIPEKETKTDVVDHVPSMPEQSAEEAPVLPLSAKEQILKLQAAISPLLQAPEEELVSEEPETEEKTAILKTAKLNGTPMRISGHRPSGTRRNALSLSSVVDREVRRSGRPQEPSATLNDSRDLRPVDNPAEQLKQAMRQMWNRQETRMQALDSFLAMDGASQALLDRLSGEEGKDMQAIVHQQLNELEAERLALVMELDHLQENRSELFKEALSQGGAQAKDLESRKTELHQSLQQLQSQCVQLEEKRAGLIRELDGLCANDCYVAPGFGEDCNFEKAGKLLLQAFTSAGFDLSKNDAFHLLLMVLSFPQVVIECEDEEDANLAARLTARALGAALAECEAEEEPVVLPGGDAFVFALYHGQPTFSNDASSSYTRLIVGDSRVLPRVRVKTASGFMMELSLRAGSRLRKDTLYRAVEEARREIPSGALPMLSRAEEALDRRMPLTLKRDILNYLSPAQILLEGGIASAIDYAFQSFIIPFARREGVDTSALRSLCSPMPLASALL